MSGNFFTKIIIVLTTVVVLRFVNVFDYGLWQLVLSVIGFFTILVLPGIEDLLINDVSTELGNNKANAGKQILKRSSIIIIILGIFSGIVLYFFAPYIALITKVNLTDILRVTAWYFPLHAVQRVYTLTFFSHQKFLLAQITTTLSRLSYLAVVVIGLFIWQVGVMSLAYAFVLSVLVSLIALFPWFLPSAISIFESESSDIDNFSFWGMIRRHGKWTLANDYFNNFVSSIRPWIIGYFLGIEWVAIISVAVALFGEIATIFPLSTILAPIVPRHVGDKDKFQRIFHKGIIYSVWFYTLIAICGFIASPYLISLLFPQYISSVLYFQIMLLALPLSPVVTIVTRIFFAVKNQKDLFLSGIIPRLSGTLIILPILSLFFGPIGVAIERVITATMLAKFKLKSLLKSGAVLPFSPKDFFTFNKDDKDFVRRIVSF